MKIFIALVLTLSACAHADTSCVTVQIESGTVCGAQATDDSGNPIVSFMGMRYAKAPLRELRFAEPQMPDKFEGVFNATVPGPICPQPADAFGVETKRDDYSEDCLRINVYVPKKAIPVAGSTNQTKMPVMVWVHGGSFTTGSGNPGVYGPDYLLTKDVILVTMNYRINSLGFLSLDSKYIPGNAGLRDILFALKWVQRNIKNFGGDPDEVTFAGQSSGGAAMHLVAISPAVKGLKLFKRIMPLSGVANANFFSATKIYAKFVAELFLSAMGISSLQSQKAIYEQLIAAPVEKILEANVKAQNTTGLPLGYVPVVETPRPGFTTILPKDPVELLKEGYDKDVTALVGFTNNEFKMAKASFKNINTTLYLFPFAAVPLRILFRANIFTVPVLTAKVWHEYFNDTKPTTSNVLDLLTDSYYKTPPLDLLELRLASKAAPTYIYEFSYHANHSIIRDIVHDDWEGAAHIEDIANFFRPQQYLPPSQGNELTQPDRDSQMKQFMTTLVTDFIKTGQPTTNAADWPPSGSKFEYQAIAQPDVYSYQPMYPYLVDKYKFFKKLVQIGDLDILG